MKLQFPSWTPPLVRQLVVREVAGEDGIRNGFHELIQRAESDGRVDDAQHLRDYEACILRLAGIDDSRMQDAYRHLGEADLTPEQVLYFVECARAVNTDYREVRAGIEERMAYLSKVSRLSAELSATLDDGWPHLFPNVAVHGDGFRLVKYGIRDLLERSPCTFAESRRRNTAPKNLVEKSAGWQENKSRVLGQWRGKVDDPEYGLLEVWKHAPTLSDCLRTLAEEFDPKNFVRLGGEEAAILRQRSPTTEYIRAFGDAITEWNFELFGPAVKTLTSSVLKAMATTVNVVLNDPELDVSAKDVRQALKVGGITEDQEID